MFKLTHARIIKVQFLDTDIGSFSNAITAGGIYNSSDHIPRSQIKKRRPYVEKIYLLKSFMEG